MCVHQSLMPMNKLKPYCFTATANSTERITNQERGTWSVNYSLLMRLTWLFPTVGVSWRRTRTSLKFLSDLRSALFMDGSNRVGVNFIGGCSTSNVTRKKSSRSPWRCFIHLHGLSYWGKQKIGKEWDRYRESKIERGREEIGVNCDKGPFSSS